MPHRWSIFADKFYEQFAVDINKAKPYESVACVEIIKLIKKSNYHKLSTGNMMKRMAGDAFYK